MNDKPLQQGGAAGRSSAYSDKIADTICERLSEGESLRAICRDEAMPAQSMVFRWLASHAPFREQYARAREAQADAIFDEILDIADDGTNDWMIRHGGDDEEAGWRQNGETLQRSKLRVDARKWMASKLQPKKYGDRLDLNHSGNIGDISEADLDARILELSGKEAAARSAGGEGVASEE